MTHAMGPRPSLLLLLGAAALAALVALFGAGTAAAAGTVNCAPYGTGTAADVQSAAASGGTVTINGVCSGTVHLSTSVVLRGGTSGATSGLDGSGAGPVVDVDGGAAVTLGNLLLTGGNCLCAGAGVSVDASTLSVNGSRVLNNTASSFGGGIYAQNSSVVNVSTSTISGNSGRYDGGGLMMNSGSNLTVNGSTISGNSVDQGVGGGISQFGATLTVNTSTISGNHADGSGGGIGVEFATASISRATITGNDAGVAGGGISSSDVNDSGGGGLTIVNSSIDHNSAESEGGGLVNVSFYGDSRVDATNTTFASNAAPFGGAVNNSGQGATASFSGSALTFTGNKSLSGLGGAIYNEAIYSFSHGLITLSQTQVGPTIGTTNANQAQRGGGIYNFVYPGLGGDAHVVLQNHTTVSHNVALESGGGGGVYTCAAGVLARDSSSRVVKNTPNNVVSSNCS